MAPSSSATTEWDVDELHRSLERGGAPHDEVIILNDGTRLETVEQVQAWIAEMVAIGRSDQL